MLVTLKLDDVTSVVRLATLLDSAETDREVDHLVVTVAVVAMVVTTMAAEIDPLVVTEGRSVGMVADPLAGITALDRLVEVDHRVCVDLRCAARGVGHQEGIQLQVRVVEIRWTGRRRSRPILLFVTSVGREVTLQSTVRAILSQKTSTAYPQVPGKVGAQA